MKNYSKKSCVAAKICYQKRITHIDNRPLLTLYYEKINRFKSSRNSYETSSSEYNCIRHKSNIQNSFMKNIFTLWLLAYSFSLHPADNTAFDRNVKYQVWSNKDIQGEIAIPTSGKFLYVKQLIRDDIKKSFGKEMYIASCHFIHGGKQLGDDTPYDLNDADQPWKNSFKKHNIIQLICPYLNQENDTVKENKMITCDMCKNTKTFFGINHHTVKGIIIGSLGTLCIGGILWCLLNQKNNLRLPSGSKQL